MKLSAKGGGDFTPHPETDGIIKGVIVDVTPAKEVEGEWGKKMVFQLVYETTELMENGDRFTVRSRSYGCSLHEKSTFRADLRKHRGRDLTPAEEAEFDVETLLGLGVNLIITHEKSKKDPSKVYATISFVGPDKSGEPLIACGKYVRVKDRPARDEKSGPGASYRKAATAEGEGRDDWQRCKVHVGKHTGLELGDLDEESVKALCDKWVPEAEAKPKPTADDKRLLAALGEAAKLLTGGAF